MTLNRKIPVILTLLMTGSASMAFADEQQAMRIIEQKVNASIQTIDELAGLQKAGFAQQEINHMQYLLLHKIENSRSDKTVVIGSHMHKKIAATASNTNS